MKTLVHMTVYSNDAQINHCQSFKSSVYVQIIPVRPSGCSVLDLYNFTESQFPQHGHVGHTALAASTQAPPIGCSNLLPALRRKLGEREKVKSDRG